MDIKLECELLKLHTLNFQKPQDLRDPLENILFNENRNDNEIGLAASKLFFSDQGLFPFLDKHVGARDPKLAETRKMLYNIISEFIKQNTTKVVEYLENIYNNCVTLFKREDSNKAKDATLHPIVQILKRFDAPILKGFIEPQFLAKVLLEDIQFCKPSATVKGQIFKTLGVLARHLEGHLKDDAFALAMTTLNEQLNSTKPELSVVHGVLVFMRYALPAYNTTQDQRVTLLKWIKIVMNPIKDTATYKIPIASIKCLRDNIAIFENQLTDRAEEMFNQLMGLLVQTNKDVKEKSSELLEKFTQCLSDRLTGEVNSHRKVFNHILDKFIDILGDKQKHDLFSLTVVIRSVGQFAKAIVKLRGDKQLAHFFDQLIELGETQVVKQFSSENEGTLKKGIHFKVILYRQKQLNSFLSSYANIVKNLQNVTDKQVHSIYEICLLCIRQHYNYFESYKYYMYESMANLILALQAHQQVAIQFMEKLFSQGTEEGLKIYEPRLYIQTCEQMGNFWSGVITQKVWGQHSLSKFTDCIFKQIGLLLQTTNFESKLQRDNLEFKWVAESPKQLIQFHRFTLMLSNLLPKMPVLNINQITFIVKNTFYKLRKYPKAVLLLIFARIMLIYIRKNDLLKQDPVVLAGFIKKLVAFLLQSLKLYTHQLQDEALTLLLCIPKELLIIDEYSLLKTSYVDIFIAAFKSGQQCLPLAWHALELLTEIVQKERKNSYKSKQILKLFEQVIPYLSSYLQLIQESEDGFYQEIIYIDSTYPFNRLLSEMKFTRAQFVEKLLFFLGSIGGLAHAIVEEIPSESLLAWDYNSPITFPILLGTRMLNLRLGQMLDRLLILCVDSPNDKLKVLSSELLHALVIYMIGQSAGETKMQSKQMEKIQKLKNDYAIMYRRIFPIVIQIANSLYHPCKEYFAQLLKQITHWLANNRQYEAPDVGALLDCLFEQPVKDTALEAFCAQLVGEFIEWTIKQTTPQELKLNYSNIKTTKQRITTYLNHPDFRYKSIGMNIAYQLIFHTHKEHFIAQKYFIELAHQIKQGLIVPDGKDATSLVKIANQLVDLLAQAFTTIDFDNFEARKGRFASLSELLDFLHDEATLGKDGHWHKIALELWLRSVKNARDRLLHQANPEARRLFARHPIGRLKFENDFVNACESLCYQCRIWYSIQSNNLFKEKEISILVDFKYTIENVEDYLQLFLNLRQQRKQQMSQFEESPLFFDINLSIPLDNFSSSQNAEKWSINQPVFPEYALEWAIKTFDRVFQFLQGFSYDYSNYTRLALGLILRPSYYFAGLQLEAYAAQLDNMISRIEPTLKQYLNVDQLRLTLNEIFDGKYIDFQDAVTNKIKDFVELRYFLTGLKWVSINCQNGKLFFTDSMRQVSKLLQSDLSLELSQALFDYLLNSNYADDFIISSLRTPTEFRQRNETQLLDYVIRRFDEIAELYQQTAKADESLLRYAMQIILKKPKTKVSFKTTRESSSVLLLEIQLKYIILTQAEEPDVEGVKELLQVALNGSNTIEIHLEALVLFGLFTKKTQQILPKYLTPIIGKYFPLKVSDLKPDSIQEVNFKAIFNKLVEMIKLSEKVELIEALFSYLPQNLTFDFSDFKATSSQLIWLMQQIQDPELGRNPVDNVRIALGNKFLIPLLVSSEQEQKLDFFIQFTKYLLDQLNSKCEDNWQSVAFHLQNQTLIIELFGIAYKYMTADQIKNQLHPKIFQNSKGNELNVKLTSELSKIKKSKFEKMYIFEAHKKEIPFNYLRLVNDYQCSAQVSLIYIFMATQSKEVLFTQYLLSVKRDKGEGLWEHIIPQDWEFNFQVETAFQEIPIVNEMAKQKNLQEQIVINYLNNTMIGTYSEAKLEEPLPKVESFMPIDVEEDFAEPVKSQADNKIEMDDINRYKLMIPMVQLIDFLSERFPINPASDTAPSWVTELWRELIIDQQPLPIRIFLLKLIMNRAKVFEKAAVIWIDPLLDYCTKENKQNGGKGFHYFMRDVVLTVIQFTMNENVRQEYIKSHPKCREKLCSVVNNLILLTAHQNRQLFKQNLQILELFVQPFSDHIYMHDQSIINMIKSEKRADSEIWQANGLSVLQVALVNSIRILGDYQEFIKTQSAGLFDKYRFVLQRRTPMLTIPSEYLYAASVNYTTKKAVLKGIAGVYGGVLNLCTKLNAMDILREYEQEVLKIGGGMLKDSRPGYGKKKFTDFLRQVCMIYPKVLSNGTLFMMASDLINQATSTERASILLIFEAYLQKIENYTNDAAYYINQIVVCIEGSINKIMSDQDDQVHVALLRLLKQIASLKILNLTTEEIIRCFELILPKIDERYGQHYDIQIVNQYFEILALLHEFLAKMEEPVAFKIVTNNLLALFVSNHSEIRKLCFAHFQRDMESKAIKQNYQRNQESSQMDRVVTLMKDIYQPKKEHLWLRGAVPLLLSQSKRNSDYDLPFFNFNLADEAHYYDMEFRNRKYFRQANLSQASFATQSQMNTQFGTQQNYLSQVINPQGVVRATQSSQQSQQQEAILESQTKMDIDGFRIPKYKRQGTNFSQFLQTNEIRMSQIQVTSTNRLRYIPESSQGIKEKSTTIFQNRVENKFAQNQVRKYRVGELPDIKIKRKDIIDPLIELCSEDEEMAGRMFTLLFEQLYEMDIQSSKVQETLLQLLSSSREKNFLFVSTILRTMYQVVKISGEFFPHNKVVKQIGLDSLAYYQSMILVEEQILILDNPEANDEENLELEAVLSNYWMDLIDLHQQQGNHAQIQGILAHRLHQRNSQLFINLRNYMVSKYAHDYQTAQKELDEARNLLNAEMQNQEADSIENRMRLFIEEEYEDTLQSLGLWDQLDPDLVKRVRLMTELEIKERPTDVAKAFHRLLQVGSDGQADIVQAGAIYQKVKRCPESYYFEIAQFFLASNDIDQSRFYLQKSKEGFLTKWSQLINQNALLSKPLRHQHIEKLQLQHELQEFQSIFKGIDIDMIQRQNVFESWATRKPSIEHDKLLTWKRIYDQRRLLASCFQPQEIAQFEGQWAIQIAKGFVKMHLLAQAEELLSYSYKFKMNKDEFDWNFYSALAKVNLKKHQLNVELRQNYAESIANEKLDGRQRVKDDYEAHGKLVQVFKSEFEKQKAKISQEEVKAKFRLLPLFCLENYVYINQDVVFLITQLQKQPQYTNNRGFQIFYEYYSSAVVDTLGAYEEGNRIVGELNLRGKFYRKAAEFCERCLRLVEPDSGGTQDLRKILERKNISLDRIADLFVQFTINSFKTQKQDNYTSNLLIKLLKVVKRFPNLIGPRFQAATEKGELPIYSFFQFLPLMMHILNSERLMPYFKNVFKDFVAKYPEQFVYQFNTMFESVYDCKNQYTRLIYEELRKRVPRNFDFMIALGQLVSPLQRVNHYFSSIKDYFGTEMVQKYIEILKRELFELHPKFYSAPTNHFVKQHQNKFNKLKFASLREIDVFLQEVRPKENAPMVQFHVLSDFSIWFQNYNDESYEDLNSKRYDIAMPLKLNGLSEIELNTIPKIASFDMNVLALTSIRQPKRIQVYGSDEKAYMYLVKGGEDLRLDQRIEHLFWIMNTFSVEAQIATYAVTPMSMSLGLLEWVRKTKPLKEFLDAEFREKQNYGLTDRKEPASKRRGDQIDQLALRFRICNLDDLAKTRSEQKHRGVLLAGDREIIQYFEECKRYMPENLLRNSLLRMSNSVEAFVFIRDRFFINYAAVCASGYILGIGDRHLDNLLLNHSTGEVIPIDFGYSFGTAINQTVPELMPFRLTQVFEGLAKPIGLNGIFRHQLIKVMTVFRNKRHTLLDFCEVFINDPILDQIKSAKNNKASQEQLSEIHQKLKIEEQVYHQQGNDSSLNDYDSLTPRIEEVWYPIKKIEIVRKKLMGVHCGLIMQEELEESKHGKANYMSNLQEVVMGARTQRLRSELAKQGTTLNVVQQVECLIDMATDPNILGRSWIGWTPYI